MQVGQVDTRVYVGGQPDSLSQQPLTYRELAMPRDTLSKLIGDGGAKVTASMDLKDSDYGSGFGAFVSVSLTVNQDVEDVEVAFGIALDLVSQFVEEAYEVAKDKFMDAHPDQRQGR